MTWTEYYHHYFTSQFLKFADWCAVAHGLGVRLTEGVINSPRPGSSMTFRSLAVRVRGFIRVCLLSQDLLRPQVLLSPSSLAKCFTIEKNKSNQELKLCWLFPRACVSEAAWDWLSQRWGDKAPGNKLWFMTWESHSKSHIINLFGKEFQPNELPSSCGTESHAHSQGWLILIHPLGWRQPRE